MIAILASVALAQQAPLELAYQKEYAYLSAEKSELQGRASAFEVDAERRLAEASHELDALQAKLVTTTREADRAEDGFDAIERETTAMDDADALLRTTVQQAADTLGLGPQEVPEAAVPVLFAAAAGRITDANSTGWSEGSYFLPDGREVDGRVFRWGQIAAWGVSDEGAGALAPAGEGRLQLRREFGTTTAAGLAAGAVPEELEVQLFEPERGAEEPEEAGGLGQTLKDAGTMGQILFGLGCVSATLTVIRGLTLLFARRGGMHLVQRVALLAHRDEVVRGKEVLGGRRNPTARVLGAILDAEDRSREELDRVVDEALLRELPKIDRFASALVVITAGSPLLGLLGTVTGMIATFDVITEHGTGNPKLMSAGIAEALICTALGLSVAIPTLLAGNVLASLGESIKNTLERGSLTLLNALERRETQARGREAHPAQVTARESA